MIFFGPPSLWKLVFDLSQGLLILILAYLFKSLATAALDNDNIDILLINTVFHLTRNGN
jgi:hypothetical protein